MNPVDVSLRRTLASDIPALFEIQLDPAGNELAGTKPRDRAAFDAVWEKILRELPPAHLPPTGVTPCVIMADGVLAGSINIFQNEGKDSIGYWLAREHWGRGIATRAIALLLAEVPTRPLSAHVVAHNVASRRALERNGFVVTGRRQSPATDRYVASETFILELA